jgi:hypothetical protein
MLMNIDLTFIRARHHFMFSIGMFEYTLGAEHLLVALAVKLDLLVLVNFAVSGGIRLAARTIVRGRGCHRESSEHRIVHRKVLSYRVMCYLVKGTFDDRVLIYLPKTFQAEGMAAG